MPYQGQLKDLFDLEHLPLKGLANVRALATLATLAYLLLVKLNLLLKSSSRRPCMRLGEYALTPQVNYAVPPLCAWFSHLAVKVGLSRCAAACATNRPVSRISKVVRHFVILSAPLPLQRYRNCASITV